MLLKVQEHKLAGMRCINILQNIHFKEIQICDFTFFPKNNTMRFFLHRFISNTNYIKCFSKCSVRGFNIQMPATTLDGDGLYICTGQKSYQCHVRNRPTNASLKVDCTLD